MEVFDIDSVPTARVKSFCILMCLKKTFPPELWRFDLSV